MNLGPTAPRPSHARRSPHSLMVIRGRRGEKPGRGLPGPVGASDPTSTPSAPAKCRRHRKPGTPDELRVENRGRGGRGPDDRTPGPFQRLRAAGRRPADHHDKGKKKTSKKKFEPPHRPFRTRKQDSRTSSFELLTITTVNRRAPRRKSMRTSATLPGAGRTERSPHAIPSRPKGPDAAPKPARGNTDQGNDVLRARPFFYAIFQCSRDCGHGYNQSPRQPLDHLLHLRSIPPMDVSRVARRRAPERCVFLSRPCRWTLVGGCSWNLA